MNSDQIFDAIEAIAAKPGKKDKEAGVKALLEDPAALNVLTHAYDPFLTYGIAKVPPRICDATVGGVFGPETFAMLVALAKRELSGNAAREAVQTHLDVLSPKSAELLTRIIKKDLRAGFTDGTINRVRPGTLAEFPYMRCVLPKKAKLDKWPWARGVISQLKADGMFANVNVYSDGTVSIHSRQGTPFPVDHPDLEALADDLSHLGRGRQYHGELLVKKDGKVLARQIGNGMLNKVSQSGELPEGHTIHFSIWDAIPLEAAVPKGTYKEPYSLRLTDLIGMVKQFGPDARVSLIETRIVKSMTEAYAHSTDCLARGLEGTIVKNPLGIWRDTSSGSPDLVKIKLRFPVDVMVVGVTEGTGKRKDTFGALCYESADGKVRGDVGTGLTDAMLAAFSAMHDLGTLVGSIIAIEANDLLKPSPSNPNHSLFLPVFIELRTDKREADTLEQIIDQMEAAKQGVGALKEAA